MKSVIEGDTDRLGLDDNDKEEEDESGDEAAGTSVLREMWLLKGGRLQCLEGGVREFERSLQKRVEKLSVCA